MSRIVDIKGLIEDIRAYRDKHFANIEEYEEKVNAVDIVYASNWLESAMISQNVIKQLGRLPNFDHEKCEFSFDQLISFIIEDIKQMTKDLIDLRCWEHNSTSYMSNFNNLCKSSAYSNLIKYFNRLVYEIKGENIITLSVF
jgi:hypothetical protein